MFNFKSPVFCLLDIFRMAVAETLSSPVNLTVLPHGETDERRPQRAIHFAALTGVRSDSNLRPARRPTS